MRRHFGVGRGARAWHFEVMSAFTIDFSDELTARLQAASAAAKIQPAEWVREAVAKALSPNELVKDESDSLAAHFTKFAGSLADDDWEPPADPPPEPTPKW